MKHWQVLGRRYLMQKRWLSLREDRVQTGRGTVIDEYHVLESPSWACVVCVTPARELVLIEQYRHGVSKVTLELPAGVIEPGEDTLRGAQRELAEETGYTARDWHPLGPLTPEPARHNHQAHAFVAHGANASQPQTLDASEDVRVRLVPLSSVVELMFSCELNHAVHVAAILLAEKRGLLDPLT